jgi:hypothetical protein
MLLSTLAIMAVTMVREAWTDERLDDLKEHMDEGFREVRADLRQQREQTASMREELGALRVMGENQQKGINARFDDQRTNTNARFDDQRNHMDTSFEALMRTIQIGFTVIGVLMAALMTLIGIWL